MILITAMTTFGMGGFIKPSVLKCILNGVVITGGDGGGTDPTPPPNGEPFFKPEQCLYEEIIRLNGCMGSEVVGEKEIEISDGCGNTDTEIIDDIVTTPIPATFCSPGCTASDGQTVEPTVAVEGNCGTIPAGYLAYSIMVLPDTEHNAAIRIGGRLYRYDCNNPNGLNHVLQSMSAKGIPFSNDIEIKTYNHMSIEIKVQRCHTFQIECPGTDIPAVPVGYSTQCFCRLSDGKWTVIGFTNMSYGPTVIVDEATGTQITAAELFTDYSKEKAPKKFFVDSCWYILASEADLPQKEQNPVYLDRWYDPVTETMCLVVHNDIPLEDKSNLLPNQNYIKMNIAGNVIPADVAKLTVPHCVTMCIAPGASITFADVLAAAVSAGLLLPAAAGGVAPTGFLLDNIMNFNVGQLALDAEGNPKKVGSQMVLLDDAEPINAGSTYCPTTPVKVDDDCDKLIPGYTPDRTITNNSATESAAVRVCGCFIPADDDDTAKAAGEKKEE